MRGVGGQEKTTLSLWKNVTISLGGVGVKVNLDNVTNFTGFFLKASLRKFFVSIFQLEGLQASQAKIAYVN